MAPPVLVGAVTIKPGVLFHTIAPAGFRLLGAIERAARSLGCDLVITSACDGEHSGPDDPHHRGEAYDVRTHGFSAPQKDGVLREILRGCADPGAGLPQARDAGDRSLATPRFFGFLEAADTPNEHIHVQLRRGRSYP